MAMTLTHRDRRADGQGPGFLLRGAPSPSPSGVGWLEVALLPPSPLSTPDQNA